MFSLIELQSVRHTRQVVKGKVCLDELLFGAAVLDAFEGQEVEVVPTIRRHAVALFKGGRHIGNAPLINGDFLDFDFVEVTQLCIEHDIKEAV